ncbi:hypothetical protein CGK74_00670 [Thauera propionica]|uniref:O-antigen ligase-related domain-containing protein n=2 Tax=Thauera propionica TaxID=2019431 RepID=A0A235F468_9RHOO|nr:hypothetical protein CGK74_00670 [Thauera propionica]
MSVPMDARNHGLTKPSDLLGLAGLYLYALGAMPSTVAAKTALLCMAIGAALQWRSFWQALRSQPLFWLLLAFAAYLAIGAVIASQAFPQTSDDQRRAVLDLLAASGPPLLLGAYWLRHDGQPRRRTTHILLLAAVGLLLTITYKGAWSSLVQVANSSRFTMGMSPNAAGILGGVLFWGALLGLLSCIRLSVAIHMRWPFALSMLALCLLGSMMLVLSGSKSAWVATALALPPLAPLYIRHALSQRQRRVALAVLAIGVLLVALYASTLGRGVLETRTGSAITALAQILDEDSIDVKDGSIGPRLQMWNEAIANVEQHPLTGWGPGSTKMLLRNSENPEIRNFPHFHNLPLHFLVSLGLLGTLLFYAIQAGLALKAWQSFRSGAAAAEHAFFTLGGLALFHVAHLFQYRLNNTPGQFLLTLAGMVALSAALQHQRHDARNESPAAPH